MSYQSKYIPQRYTSGPNKGRFMRKDKCLRCETFKQNEAKGKIFTPAPYVWSGHRIVDMKSLADGLWCKVCENILSLSHCVGEKRDSFASNIRVKCIKCGTIKNINTSPDCNNFKVVKLDKTPGNDMMVNDLFHDSNGSSDVQMKDPLSLDDDEAVPKTRARRSGKSLLRPRASTSKFDHNYVMNMSDLDNSDMEFIMDDDYNDKDYVADHKSSPEETSASVVEMEDESIIIEKPNPSGLVFHCEYCSSQFNTKKSCMQHMREAHPEFNDLICAWCQRKCVSLSAFRSHRRSHRGEAGCMCETCGKRCRNVKHLELHKLDHLPDDQARKFACSKCGKRYKTEAYVLKHERLHSTRAFCCNECPKKFLTKQRLEEHMQLHTGDFKFLCEICSARFTRKDNLTQHLKQNHRYVCPLCNFTFTTADEVKTHRTESHTQRELAESEADGHAPFYKYTDFQCSFCHRFLASKQSLNFHIATHTGEGKKRSNPSKKVTEAKVLKIGSSFQEPEVHIHEGERKNESFLEKHETLAATYNLIRVAMDQ